jgi:hypothetical protein
MVTGTPNASRGVIYDVPASVVLAGAAPGNLPASGIVSQPAAAAAASVLPAPQLVQSRRLPLRRSRSSVTAGMPPQVIVPQPVRTRRVPAAARPRGRIAAGITVTVAAVIQPFAVAVRAVRRQPPARPRGRIVTGMTPGSGVAFVPPPSPVTRTSRRLAHPRPRGRFAAVPQVPPVAVAVTRAVRRTALARPRGIIRAPLPVPPVTPAVTTAARRQPARRPRSLIAAGITVTVAAAAVQPAPLDRTWWRARLQSAIERRRAWFGADFQ